MGRKENPNEDRRCCEHAFEKEGILLFVGCFFLTHCHLLVVSFCFLGVLAVTIDVCVFCEIVAQ